MTVLDVAYRRLAASETDAHVHDWRIAQVEFDDFGQVRELHCTECSAVWFA